MSEFVNVCDRCGVTNGHLPACPNGAHRQQLAGSIDWQAQYVSLLERVQKLTESLTGWHHVGPAPRFNVGDRVKVARGEAYDIGSIGTVIPDPQDSCGPYRTHVKIDGDLHPCYHFFSSHLESYDPKLDIHLFADSIIKRAFPIDDDKADADLRFDVLLARLISELKR